MQWPAMGVVNQRDALEDEHLVSVGVDVAPFEVIAAQLSREHPLRKGSISLCVVGMNDISNVAGQKAVFPISGDLTERSVDAQPATLSRDKRHADGCVIEGASKSLLTFLEGARLPFQIDEHVDLRTQDRGIERFDDIVDGSGRVSLEHMTLLGADPGQKDNRDVSRLLQLLDNSRRLEAVETRHLNIQQDQSEVCLEEMLQGLLARRSANEVAVGRFEDSLECSEVLWAVVDQKDVVTVLGLPFGPARTSGVRPRRVGGMRRRRQREVSGHPSPGTAGSGSLRSHLLKRENRRSKSTGFAM